MDGSTRAREILERLGLPADGLVLAPRQGVANETWLTPTHVVRLSKDPEYLEDLYTESVAAPAAFQAGVATPELIALVLPTHSVWARVEGNTLADTEELSSPEDFFFNYGRMLRSIHDVPEPPDPEELLDEPWVIDTEELLDRAEQSGHQDLIAQLLATIAPAYDRRFVHQDLHAENVLVDPQEQPAVIDWGDAGMGDPAVDFRFVPLAYLGPVLAGYGSTDAMIVGRLLLHQWDQLFYARQEGRRYGRWGESSSADLIQATSDWLSQS